MEKSSMPICRDTAKVIVPKNIFSTLEFIRNQRSIRMTDVPAVIQRADGMGLFEVTQWIKANGKDYLKGAINGFQPQE